jgi:hypothetical protein
MSVYVCPQSSYSRGRGIRASEVAREMLESPNMGRCIEDLLPRMHIIDDRNDATPYLYYLPPCNGKIKSTVNPWYISCSNKVFSLSTLIIMQCTLVKQNRYQNVILLTGLYTINID